MSWYAAHAVMYVKFKDGKQDRYPVWENILLIEAHDDESARAIAGKRAKRDEGDSEGTFTWQGRPASWVFAGLRKLISVSHAGSDGQIRSEDEITYSEFELSDEASLRRLLAGDEVTVSYVE